MRVSVIELFPTNAFPRARRIHFHTGKGVDSVLLAEDAREVGNRD